MKQLVQASEVTQPLGQEVNLHRAGPAQGRGASIPEQGTGYEFSDSCLYQIQSPLSPQGGKKSRAS